MRLTPLRLAFLFGAALFLLGPTAGFTQPGRGGKGKGNDNGGGVQPGGGGGKGGPGGMQMDPAQWAQKSFEKMSNGGSTIVIANVQPSRMDPNAKETMQDWATAHGITNGQLTLDQYTEFFSERMQQFQNKGNKGPGGGPGNQRGQPGPGVGIPNMQPQRDLDKDAEVSFRYYDKDNEGQLDIDHMPRWLQDEWEQWDKNHDAHIDLAEYKEAYKAHMEFQRGTTDGNNNRDPRNRNNRDNQQNDLTPDDEKRPTVYHVGHLPKDLPPWFEQMDSDKDGQVGLYEWKKINQDVRLFMEIDTNSDGFLTVEEVLRWQKKQIALKKEQANKVAAENGDDDDPDAPAADKKVQTPGLVIPGLGRGIQMPGGGRPGGGGQPGGGRPGGGGQPGGGRGGPGAPQGAADPGAGRGGRGGRGGPQAGN